MKKPRTDWPEVEDPDSPVSKSPITRQLGRKPFNNGHAKKNRCVTLDDLEEARLREIGQGNLSRGIRVALEIALRNQDLIPAAQAEIK